MKSKFLIFSSVFAIATVAIFLWFHRPSKQEITTQLIAQSATNEQAGTHTITHFHSVVPHGTAISHSKEELATASNKAVELREYQLQQIVGGGNVPLQFYGQIFDQDGQPLSGVHVKMIAVHNVFVPPESIGESNLITEKITDLAGRFEWTTGTGSSIDIESIAKEGYELEAAKLSYGPNSGSFQFPVLFKMWNKIIHEKLITGNKAFNIVPDGRPYFINLNDGTISNFGIGDLKVWIQYTNQPMQSQLYDWSAGIEVLNGGLLEQPLGAAMYEAPMDDYTPLFQIGGQIKGGQRGDTGERHFYLKLKNGQEYGQISISLIAPFNDQIPGLIRLSYTVNPSGSHILR